jgi:hypothetical protein
MISLSRIIDLIRSMPCKQRYRTSDHNGSIDNAFKFKHCRGVIAEVC